MTTQRMVCDPVTIMKRRCACGRVLVMLANGTVPRHTRMIKGGIRIRCVHVGELFPAVARERGLSTVNVARRVRGGRRAAKRDTKNLFRRNAAGGYNGRPGSAGSPLKKVG